jgi:hypothetical protein
VVGDYFGDGLPANWIAGTVKFPSDFSNGRPDRHGYDVLGVINASHDRRSGVTGIFPDNLRIRVVDGQNIYTMPGMENEIIRRIRSIVESDENARIVLNTSLGMPKFKRLGLRIKANKIHGDIWFRKVKQFFGIDLESNFIHIASAGNLDGFDPYPVYENSPWNYAAYGPSMSQRLNNTLAVENRTIYTSRGEEGAANRPEPGCTSVSSVMGSGLSAIGTDIYSNTPQVGLGEDPKTSGTSFAAPQVAGTVAFMWAVNPSLEFDELISRLKATTRDSQAEGPGPCSARASAPVIDAYDAVLAAGGNDVREALLDVTESGSFSEQDIEVFLSEWEAADGMLDYSRYDLNGTGQTGGDATDRFDLNHDISFGTVSQNIEGEIIEFDEEVLTDQDILCYYAFSDLYDGDAEARSDLLSGPCLGVEITEATITGTITDEETGEGIEAATVSGTDPATGSDLFETSTDTFGDYEVTFTVDVAPSEITIFASADGYEETEQTVDFAEEFQVNLTLDTDDSGKQYGPAVRYAPGDGFEYFVTTTEYTIDDDLHQEIEDEFGITAELVDWNDLKDLFQDDEDGLISFLEGIGMKRGEEGYVSSAYVQRGGSRFRSSSRHYFVSRHDGNVPGGWLVHDQLHYSLLSLGSWHHSREAMVRVQPH